MQKLGSMADRRELHNRIRHLRYSIIEEAIDVLAAEPKCDPLIETLLDSVKGIEASNRIVTHIRQHVQRRDFV